MTDAHTAATAGLLALGVGAFAAGKRKASRGPPGCQAPDCNEDATAESDWTYCDDHGGVEVPIRG